MKKVLVFLLMVLTGLQLEAQFSRSGERIYPTKSTWYTPYSFATAKQDSVYINYAGISRTYLDSLCAIVQIGDSHTQYSTSHVSNALWNQYGYGGFGWQTFKETYYTTTGRTTGLTLTNTWGLRNKSDTVKFWGIDGFSIVSNSVNDSVRIAPAAYMTWTKARVWFAQYAGGGDIVIRVDGGTPDTVSTDGAANLAYYEIDGLTSSNHTLSVKVASTDTVILYGVDAIDTTTTGITYYNLGCGGAWLYSANRWSGYMMSFLDVVRPNLLTEYFGYNDLYNGISATTTATTLGTYVDKLKTATGTEVMIVVGFRSRDTAAIFNQRMLDFRTLARTLAKTKSTSFLSTYDMFAKNGIILPMGLTDGSNHLSTYGNQAYANTLRNILVGEPELLSPYGNQAVYNKVVTYADGFGGDNLVLDAPASNSTIVRFKRSGAETGVISVNAFNQMTITSSDQTSIGGNGTYQLFIGGSSKKTMAMSDFPSATGMFYIKGTSVPSNFLEFKPYGSTAMVARLDTSGTAVLKGLQVSENTASKIDSIYIVSDSLHIRINGKIFSMKNTTW